MFPLPIDKTLPSLRDGLEKKRNVVLSAEPGAGKTTRVPPALLECAWLAGKKIIMLEPRRLAAQRAAAYMSQELGEKVGGTIGYRIRGETKIGKTTRIEVVTEGILTRLLQNDPGLPGVGIVIFDEFHERSIHADLGLALTLNVQEQIRSDLRILVMSATLDHLAVASLLGDAATITSEGRIFPVTTHYLKQRHDDQIEKTVAVAVHRALREEPEGDILVFLPGQREIRRVESLLADSAKSGELPENVIVHTLFGDAPPDRQQAALTPAPRGKRKVILSTSVAETSVTIDGVRVVIDSGLARSARFDLRRGMSGLVTTPVSQSSADQRRGRAGRQQPGVCYRLWTEQQHGELPPYSQPEILSADLAPLALEFARWGDPAGATLRFLDPPPEAHLSQARGLLTRLGALDGNGKLTSHGQAMAELPVHPRFAHMLIRAQDLGLLELACDVAALLEERDLLRGENDRDVDLHSRWFALKKGGRDKFARERVMAQAERLRQIVESRMPDSPPKKKAARSGGERLGVLVALAYPERVAKRREKESLRYQTAGGAGAALPKTSMLSKEEYLAIAEVDGAGNEVKIFLAEPISESDIGEIFARELTIDEEVHWDERKQAVVARQVTKLGAIELSEVPLTTASELVIKAMLDGVRQMGLEALPWTKNAKNIRERAEWLRNQNITRLDLPDLTNEHLISTLDFWLAPYLAGITRRSHLERLDMTTIVQSMFSYKQLQELDRLAPTHHIVPTGSRIPIQYTTGETPVLAVRLQEMFGETDTPTVAGGKIKVVLHLLSPAQRPLAVTQDLPSFWKNAYPDVRKDMRGRYPKHYWPENPLEAELTRRVKRFTRNVK
jgi:ATP-dependent helicase HrpB